MMSYTMECTSSCSIGGRLMRRMSPCTRIIGGSPADRCRSDALFLTANASSSVISIYNPQAPLGDYGPVREVVARSEDMHRTRRALGGPRSGGDQAHRGQQDL